MVWLLGANFAAFGFAFVVLGLGNISLSADVIRTVTWAAAFGIVVDAPYSVEISRIIAMAGDEEERSRIITKSLKNKVVMITASCVVFCIMQYYFCNQNVYFIMTSCLYFIASLLQITYILKAIGEIEAAYKIEFVSVSSLSVGVVFFGVEFGYVIYALTRFIMTYYCLRNHLCRNEHVPSYKIDYRRVLLSLMANFCFYPTILYVSFLGTMNLQIVYMVEKLGKALFLPILFYNEKKYVSLMESKSKSHLLAVIVLSLLAIPVLGFSNNLNLIVEPWISQNNYLPFVVLTSSLLMFATIRYFIVFNAQCFKQLFSLTVYTVIHLSFVIALVQYGFDIKYLAIGELLLVLLLALWFFDGLKFYIWFIKKMEKNVGSLQ